MSTQSQITYYPLTVIKSSQLNPRKLFDESSLNELADSLKSMGMLSPIICRQNKNGKALLEIVCGERRFRAAKIAGLDQVPVIFKDLTDDEALDLMITENLQRADVSPLEEASSFKRLIEMGKYDIQALAGRFGKSETYIRIRLKLNDLVPVFRILLEQDIITVSHAQEICKISPNYQNELYDLDFKNRPNWWTTPTIKNLKSRIEQLFFKVLSEAIFPLDDSILFPTAGACNACLKNTASNALLFPDSKGKGHCLDHTCFQTKSEAFLKLEIERIQNNCPEVVIGIPDYMSSDDKRTAQEMITEGIDLIEITYQNGFTPVSPPEPVEKPLTEDYTDPDEYIEAVQEFETEEAEYKKELDEYNKKLVSGEFVKVFFPIGPYKGRTRLFEKTGDTAETSGKTEVSTVKKQVEELKAKDSRNKELAFEKIYNEAKQLLSSDEYIAIDDDLSENEMTAFFVVLLQNLNLNLIEDITGKKTSHWIDEKDRLQYAHELSTQMKNRLMRNYIRRKLDTTTPVQFISEGRCLVTIARDLYPDEVERIETTHNGVYLRRKEKIDARIEELTGKKK